MGSPTPPRTPEMVDVVDDDDRALRRVTRSEMRGGNLLHRAVYVLVRSSRGELFVHRRTDSKDVYPGRWDVTIGGVVAAGEDYAGAARRELAEELGVTGARIEALGPIRYADTQTQLLGMVFAALHDGPVVLQADEIATGSFAAADEVARLVATRPCCPDGVAVLRRYLAEFAPR